MLFPLEPVAHTPDLNLFALDHEYWTADAGDAAPLHGAAFSKDAAHQSEIELGFALSLAIVVSALIDACAPQFHNRPHLRLRRQHCR
jgi:hypothetical protein